MEMLGNKGDPHGWLRAHRISVDPVALRSVQVIAAHQDVVHCVVRRVQLLGPAVLRREAEFERLVIQALFVAKASETADSADGA